VRTLTIDGLRGAVLQMILTVVVVGFFISEIIFRRYETRLLLKWVVFAHNQKFASMFLLLVLASVALPTTFNFVGEFVLYSLSQINVWFAFLGGTTIILGAYYMLKMYQQVMLEKQIQKCLLM
jgi:NADH-quinone oxidoreductase subunit M